MVTAQRDDPKVFNMLAILERESRLSGTGIPEFAL
jgi:hypothetical protein